MGVLYLALPMVPWDWTTGCVRVQVVVTCYKPAYIARGNLVSWGDCAEVTVPGRKKEEGPVQTGLLAAP